MMLEKSANATRRAVLYKASKDMVLALVELAKNIIKGNVDLTADQYRRLDARRVDVRTLAHPRTSMRNRKKILQKGGFIGLLLKPALGLLGGLLGGLVPTGRR